MANGLLDLHDRGHPSSTRDVLQDKQEIQKEKRLVWGDITLVITKSKLTGGDNQLSHFFESPNAKRKKFWTLELDEFPVLWLDATFYLLIIAHIAGAFPNGWTYEQLLDPLKFNSRPGDCFESTFNPESRRRRSYSGQTTGPSG